MSNIEDKRIVWRDYPDAVSVFDDMLLLWTIVSPAHNMILSESFMLPAEAWADAAYRLNQGTISQNEIRNQIYPY